MTNVVLDESGELPLKSSMTELQAAIGLSLLDRIDTMLKRRKFLANMIKEGLKNINEIIFQQAKHSSSHLLSFNASKNKF